MRVSELSGAPLDHWVARAMGYKYAGLVPYELCGTWYAGESDGGICDWSPSENWAQAGPIIEDNAIGFYPISDAEWMAEEHITARTGRGPTPLIAAMRAYVASKFGDEVADEEA